ncbi:Starch-binding associating with outer membrane [Salegentibacter salegens]|uniref:Starch-binding associating with outer membrane n=1 Tax=Salegentibacter salegens TaxID=143223 RepID=A0A1M7MDR4_9FLAO|nr:RagB/SusD family nutrient uptake outer membrane protein [Salegentibacter salegens]SHM88960.1 Starch-binding associating with outer membrane [Salegentibacter salegens]
MKKINNIIIGFIVLTCVACSEDLLDKDPVSSFSAQGFYQNASDAQAGVYGTYDALQSVMRVNFAYWGEGRADAVSTIQAGDPGLLQQNNLTPIMSSASWNNLYEMISRANYAIKYIPDVFGEDSPLGGELMGQARALRALGYFYAVRIWGDVPLILEPYESIDQDIFLEKADESQIMDQIIDDLSFVLR